MEGFDSLVKDITLAEWGRKEIELAQVEMPGTLSSHLTLILPMSAALLSTACD